MNDHSREERRRFVRVSVDYFLECTQLDFTDTTNDKIPASIKNISAGGILFVTHKKYELGTLLRISLSIPGWDQYKTEFYKSAKALFTENLVVLAKVARIEPGKREGQYNVAVEFTGIDDDHQRALLKFIRNQMKEI